MARHSDAPRPDGGGAPDATGAPSAASGPPSGPSPATRAAETILDAERDAAPDHDVRAVLRITAFRRLWLALGLSSFGDWLGLLATAALAKTLASGSYTAENFAIAGVFILRLAPAIFFGPIAGALADKLNRRWTLVVGDVLRFVLFASIPLVGTLGWLYIATVLIECVALFWMPAKDATVPNLVPRRRLEAANQISLVATYGSAPLAALVYSGLALLTGILDNYVQTLAGNPVNLALYFNALTFLVSALTIWRLEIPQRAPSAGEHAGVVRLILDGWKFVGSTPVVRGLILGMLGAFAAAGFVVGLAQTFVADLGAGQPGFGVLFGAVFVGLAAGMWVGPRVLVEFSRRRLFGLALTAAGVFLVLLALVPNIVMAALFTTAVGACGGIAWVTGYTLLGLEVDDEVRGRTFGFLQSAARVVLVGVLALGPALAAPIGRHSLRFTDYVGLTYNGAAWVFLLAGAVAVVMGITAFRQMDDRPGTPLVADLRRAWASRSEGPRPARGTSPGYFIALEGGDGAGKSTQAKLLGQWLRESLGHEVVVTREPGATPVGVRLRDVLLGHEHTVGPRAEALLFAADRAHHVATVVRPALERGAVVVTDRFVDSSIAYQGAGRDLDADDVARFSRWATGGLVPDLTVLLDLPPQISTVRRRRDAERGDDDSIEAESDAFHERVRERFLDLAQREPHRYLVLDASESREDIQAAIRARLRDVVPVSAKKRAELVSRLAEEELARRRTAAAEAEVLRLDAELRGRSRDESLAREQARQRAREEAERALREEAASADAPTAVVVPSGAPSSAPSSVVDLPSDADADAPARPAPPSVAARPQVLPVVPPESASSVSPVEPDEPDTRTQVVDPVPGGATLPPAGAQRRPAAPSSAAPEADPPAAAGAPQPLIRRATRSSPEAPVEPVTSRLMRRVRAVADAGTGTADRLRKAPGRRRRPPDGQGGREPSPPPPTAAVDLSEEIFGSREGER